MPLLYIFWYCFDDTLARLLEAPTLGSMPGWMWFWTCLVMNIGFVNEATKEI